jgi:hypothetical protein
MRKIMIIVTLAFSWLAVSATMNASVPTPQCDPNCTVQMR